MNLTYKQLLIITEVRQHKGIHKKTTSKGRFLLLAI
jgi:hypothetical protein